MNTWVGFLEQSVSVKICDVLWDTLPSLWQWCPDWGIDPTQGLHICLSFPEGAAQLESNLECAQEPKEALRPKTFNNDQHHSPQLQISLWPVVYVCLSFHQCKLGKLLSNIKQTNLINVYQCLFQSSVHILCFLSMFHSSHTTQSSSLV